MDVIILAAGIGSRMKLDYPKQFYKINGKPFFIYSLEVISKMEIFDNIILMCNKDYFSLYKESIKNFNIKNVKFIEGGGTRQESVYKGLLHVKSERVLIHEAARPLISVEFINYLLSFNEDSVVPVVPVNFTVSGGEQFMVKEYKREELKNVQLPQVFNSEMLLSCHEKAIKEGYQATEDGTLVFHYGNKVRFVEGRDSNIKITNPLDILVVNNLMNFN